MRYCPLFGRKKREKQSTSKDMPVRPRNAQTILDESVLINLMQSGVPQGTADESQFERYLKDDDKLIGLTTGLMKIVKQNIEQLIITGRHLGGDQKLLWNRSAYTVPLEFERVCEVGRWSRISLTQMSRRRSTIMSKASSACRWKKYRRGCETSGPTVAQCPRHSPFLSSLDASSCFALTSRPIV